MDTNIYYLSAKARNISKKLQYLLDSLDSTVHYKWNKISENICGTVIGTLKFIEFVYITYKYKHVRSSYIYNTWRNWKVLKTVKL